jgi:hypothetical protein
MRRRVFVRWAIVLTVVWVFANWPQRVGLNRFFYRAGFPLTFAWGTNGNPEDFDAFACATDGLIGIVVVLGFSSLCAWSR